MKKIGEGFYYKVFNLGNGRVLKKQMSFFSRVRKLIAWGGVEGISPFAMLNYQKMQKKFNASLVGSRELLNVLPQSILGNPVFLNNYEYEQDKVIPLVDTLPYFTDEQFFARAYEYVVLQKLLWTYGYSDQVFNFTINCGIDEKTKKLILLDFNELTSSKEKVLKNIANKKWNTQMSLRDFPRAELKEHISRLFENEFTNQEVETLWNTKN